jgi:3-hydroxy-3-methylglutaryl CoA synthase
MSKVGITSYGVHIPWYRLNRKTIASALGPYSGGAAQGDKAVANFDEDSLSMAVSASLDGLKGMDRRNVSGLMFASVSAPCAERSTAATLAASLDLNPNIRSADFADTLKAGTDALLFAADFLQAGHGGSVLVCASDIRLGRPGSPEEMLFGDAAAAIVLGTEGTMATLEGSYTTSYDFPDYRRLALDKFVRSTEDRFIREEGYGKIIPGAVNGILKKYKLEAKDIARVSFPHNNAREQAGIGVKLGFTPEQILTPLNAVIGETGTVSPLISLIAMLEDAKPGDTLLAVGYGNGADALLFKVTPEIEKVKAGAKLKKALAGGGKLTSYEKYLVFRGLLPVPVLEKEISRTQLPLLWREQGAILALHGTKCKKCGTAQYPPQRICVNPACNATDEMESYCFAEKNARLFSFTEDFASTTTNPPLIYGFVDFEGGGRWLFDITDVEAGTLKLGMKMKMSLRVKYQDNIRGFIGYFWKAVPVKE